MSSIDVNQVLAQMRSLAAQAQGLPPQAPEAAGPGADFASLLKGSLEHVNGLQQEAGRLSTAFEQGEAGVDLAQVMVAIQKASISFQAATQVRNRLISAYQDVMNMPV